MSEIFNEKRYSRYIFRNSKLAITYQTMTDKCKEDGGRQPGARIKQVVSHGCVVNE